MVLGNRQFEALYQESHSPEENRNSSLLTLKNLAFWSIEFLEENFTVSFLNFVKLGSK